MNNSVYGRTMEDIRTHTNISLVSNPRSLEKRLNNPLFKRVHKMNEDLVFVEMARGEGLLNKPIYVGMSILEYSKQHMNNFFYNVMKPFYGNRVSLIYTDTDSLILNIQTEDLFKDYEKYKDHLYLIGSKTFGLMKDEAAGSVITEVVALRPQTYCYDKVKNKYK